MPRPGFSKSLQLGVTGQNEGAQQAGFSASEGLPHSSGRGIKGQA